jgi:hypothetical protein
MEVTVGLKLQDGSEFIIVEADDRNGNGKIDGTESFDLDWTYDGDTNGNGVIDGGETTSGLMVANKTYSQVFLHANKNGLIDAGETTTLATYLAANPSQIETGDTWTIVYTDNEGGNDQARVAKFQFFFNDPGDPGIKVVGDDDCENVIYGTETGKDSLTGGALADHILGRGADDFIDGQEGDDLLEGGGGKDVITGGAGNDTIVGGAGTAIDTYKYAAADDITAYDDLIKDFTVDNAGTVGTNEGDIFDISALTPGTVDFSISTAGYVNLVDVGGKVGVQVDADGGGNNYQTVAVLDNVAFGAGAVQGLSGDGNFTIKV